MEKEEEKNEILLIVKEGNVMSALEKLYESEHYLDQRKNILILINRLHNIENHELRGTLGFNEIGVEKNSIVNSLIKILNYRIDFARRSKAIGASTLIIVGGLAIFIMFNNQWFVRN